MANTEKLEQLANVIELADSTGQWSMGSWGSFMEERENSMPGIVPQQECGFAACAAGWTLLLDGWELTFRDKYQKGDVVLENEYELADMAAEILEIESPWIRNEWNNQIVSQDEHLFFWTSMNTWQIVEAVKLLAKGEEMEQVRYLILGEDDDSEY